MIPYTPASDGRRAHLEALRDHLAAALNTCRGDVARVGLVRELRLVVAELEALDGAKPAVMSGFDELMQGIA